MMKKVALFLLLALACVSVKAQRFTDKLDRGLVAVVPKSGSGIFLSWRIQADEYYDVTYNVYKNGTKVASDLNVSNYTDASGKTTDKYKVTAVVKGVEQEASKEAVVFGTNAYTERGIAGAPAYYSIKVADVVNRNGVTVWSNNNGTVTKSQNYIINDISLGDLNGDGKIEFIVKRANQTDDDNHFLESNTTDYNRIEVYDWGGNLMWWIDCGPNMVSSADKQWDAVAYDWDMDGKAEVMMRGADNMIIHMANGTTREIGNMNVNTRNTVTHRANEAYTNTGAEYLIYMNGETGEPYWVKTYPIARGNDSDWNPSTGGIVGHRSSKYFIGAPFLDGRKASLFLGRGIYTKTEMVAYDIDPSTHELSNERSWSSGASGDWFGQGYHNYGIADVDGDGCDEIVYGSMVIDNNLKGLSTTGLGHGDAQHCGDLDPFTKGLEIFACNEDKPGNNFRNATTSEIYYRNTTDSDDGRCLAGNFTNSYPGCIAASVSSGIISCASHTLISELANNCFQKPWNPMSLNFRIYWDGDLQEESMDSPGTESECVVIKEGNRIMQTKDVHLINSTKNNPCAQGDIIGDWREEIILRKYDNTEFRIYSTTDPTAFRIPSLWYDHQYRQAMVWQAEGYNQPPHTSFFLGELEGITKAPVPLTNEGRVEIAVGTDITASNDGERLMVVAPLTANSNFFYNGPVSPTELVVNVPTLVSGNNDNSKIKYDERTCTMGYKGTSPNINGLTRLIKQGEGLLAMPNKALSYSGDTEIWAGSIHFRGTLPASNVWMNRHTNFYCGATIQKSLTMEYGATLYPSFDAKNATTVEYNTATAIATLNMHEGSRIVFQINAETGTGDEVKLGILNIRKQNWEYGPKYLAPVFEIQPTSKLKDGKYKLGTVGSLGTGNINDIILECETNPQAELVIDDNVLYLVVDNSKDIVSHPANATVVGTEDNATPWWGGHSPSYTLTDGQKLHLEFRNYNGQKAGSIYNNYVLVCSNDVDRAAAGYTEYFVTRCDNYGWQAKYDQNNRIYTCDWGDKFVEYTDGAWVVMDIVYDKGVVSYNTVVTSYDEVHTFTDKFKADGISGPVRLFLTVDNSHLAIDNSKLTISNLGTYQSVFVQNFEGSDWAYGWTIGIADRLELVQYNSTNGSNSIWLKVNTNNNGTNATYTLPSFNAENDYIFEFDFAQTSNTERDTNRFTSFALKDDAGLEIATFKTYSNKTEGGLYVGNGECLKTYGVTTNNAEPTIWHHVILKSDESGTTILIDGGTPIKVSESFVKVSSIFYDTNRYYPQLKFDNISLSVRQGSPILSDITMPSYESGMYSSVTIKRTLVQGYNTLCLPFDTNVETVAGTDAKAYTLANGTMSGNTLYFPEVADGHLLANRPYVIWCPSIHTVPDMGETTLAAAQPMTVEGAGWKMVGNYTPHFLTEGKYVIYGDELRKCGSTAYVDGMRAYFIAPANPASAKIRVRFGDDDIESSIDMNSTSSEVQAIYGIDGKKRSALQRGINIIRMTDGSVRKEYKN